MNEEKAQTTPRRPEAIRISSVISFVFLSAVAIVIAYILGVMVGRGGAAPDEAPAVPQNAPPPAASREAEDRGGFAILKPQELDYAQVLRNEKVRAKSVPEQSPAAPAAPDEAARAQAREKEAQEGAVQEEKPQERAPLAADGEEAAQEARAAAPEKAPERPQDAGMADYVFQVGAFRDEAAADALRQKLEGRDLRTRLRREGSLYVVLVLLRGDQARAAEVAAIAHELRLGEPLVRSRKPAAP